MDQDQTQQADRRRQKRQSLELLLHLVSVDERDVDLRLSTRNISTGGGVLFESPESMAEGAGLKYVVTLSDGDLPVKITCTGRVVRCHPLSDSPANGFEIACTMKTYRFVSHPEDAHALAVS